MRLPMRAAPSMSDFLALSLPWAIAEVFAQVDARRRVRLAEWVDGQDIAIVVGHDEVSGAECDGRGSIAEAAVAGGFRVRGDGGQDGCQEQGDGGNLVVHDRWFPREWPCSIALSRKAISKLPYIGQNHRPWRSHVCCESRASD
jgi:hypothetical protein